MRHGLDQALLSAFSSTAKSDAKPRGRADRARGEAAPFQVEAEEPTRSRANDRASWRAEARQRATTQDTKAGGDAPGRVPKADRPEPPRRSDPPRREDAPRRDDPPGHMKAGKAERPDKADKLPKKEKAEEASEGATETDETAEASEETAPAAPPCATAGDPTLAVVPPAVVPNAAAADAAADGELTAEAAGPAAGQQAVVTARAENPPATETGAPVGKAEPETGTAHALAVMAAKGKEPPPGLQAAADKKKDEAEPAAGEAAPEAFAKLAEAAGRENPGAEAPTGKAAPPLAEPKVEATAISSPPPAPQPSAGTRDPSAAAPQAAQARAEPPVPVVQQVPLGAVPIEIGLKSLAGVNRFEIRLDPAELGRIDVKLEIDPGGEVKAQLVVDRVETLHLLQRDAKTLERAFEQAGLKPSEGGVELQLRDPSADSRQNQGRERDENRSGPHRNTGADPDRADAAPAKPQRMYWRGTAGVDVRI